MRTEKTKFVPMTPLMYAVVRALARERHVSVDVMTDRILRAALRRRRGREVAA